MLELNYEEIVTNKIAHTKKSIGYTDPYRKYTLDEAWATKKTIELQATGVQKLKEMFQRAEELGYSFTSAQVKAFGLVFVRAQRDGQVLGGYADPNGKLVLGLVQTRTPALKITYRKHLNHKDSFLQAILKDSGFRK